MPLDQLTAYWPVGAILAGVAVALWGHRDRIKSIFAGFTRPKRSEPSMSPTDRFETFYALRAWCEASCHTEAVIALDTRVLPTLVLSEVHAMYRRDGGDEGGGNRP